MSARRAIPQVILDANKAAEERLYIPSERRFPGMTADPCRRLRVAVGDFFRHIPSGTVIAVRSIGRSDRRRPALEDVLFDVYHRAPGTEQPPARIARAKLFEGVRTGVYRPIGRLTKAKDRRGRHIERFTHDDRPHPQVTS